MPKNYRIKSSIQYKQRKENKELDFYQYKKQFELISKLKRQRKN